MICNIVKDDCNSLDNFLKEGEQQVQNWLNEHALIPQELTNIIVGYQSRADFVPNSLFTAFEN